MQRVEIIENQKRVSSLGPFSEVEAQRLIEEFTKTLAAKNVELVQHEKTSPFDLREMNGLAEMFIFQDDRQNTFQINVYSSGHLLH